MEESNQTDLSTNLRIRVSVSVRKIYREYNPELYGSMRNIKLNEEIAKDFNSYSSYVLHHFPLTRKGKREVGEIRGGDSQYFVSAIRDGYIDILAMIPSWKIVKSPIKERSKFKL